MRIFHLDGERFTELNARQRSHTLLDPGSGRELLDPFERLMSPWLGAQQIVPQADDGVVVLKGNLCPDGALIKIAGLKRLTFEGRARVFENEEACTAAVRERRYQAGDVLVIRNEGPRGGPGMREMLSPTGAIMGEARRLELLRLQHVDTEDGPADGGRDHGLHHHLQSSVRHHQHAARKDWYRRAAVLVL